MKNVYIPEGAKVHHNVAKKAARINSMLEAEYPRIEIEAETTDGMIERWVSTYADNNENHELLVTAKFPDLADLLEECESQGLDAEAGSKPARSGSVVSQSYRDLYRETSSNGQTCGDWLAEILVTNTHGPDGFRFEDFEQVLVENNVDLTAKWATAQRNRGWKGRYRMNGRQVLEKVVTWHGYLTINGTNHEAPDDILAKFREKHGKWYHKQLKLHGVKDETDGE